MNKTQTFLLYSLGEYLNFMDSIGKHDAQLVSEAKKEFLDISKNIMNENEAEEFSKFLGL